MSEPIDLDELERLAKGTGRYDAPWDFEENEEASRVFGSRTAFEVGVKRANTGLLLTPSRAIAEYAAACSPDRILALVEEVRRLRGKACCPVRLETIGSINSYPPRNGTEKGHHEKTQAEPRGAGS